MPELAVERVPIDDLEPDPENVRTHPARNLEAIRASLERFGQARPIVVDGNGIIIAGNGTYLAARDLGWAELDVIRFSGTRAEARAFAIADNRTAELAEWDGQALLEALTALSLDDLVGPTGFTDDELADLNALFGPPPSVEDLRDKYGEPEDEALWPTITLRVPHKVFRRWVETVREHDDDPAKALTALLGL